MHLPIYWKKVWSISTSELEIKKYKSGSQRRQYYLKIQGPESQNEKAVIYLHGGGWLFGSPEGFVQNAMVFTRKGYTVYMPSYRRLPVYDFQAMYIDLKKTCLHIKSQRSTPIKKLIISGMSAGAHLGAILSLDQNINWEEMLNSKKPLAYIGVGAPLDLDGMWQSPVLKLLTRKGYDTANPMKYLHKNAPLLFSLSAGKDGIVYNQSQINFEKKAKTMGLDITEHHFPDKCHMEIAEWSIAGNNVWKAVYEFVNRLDKVE